MGLVGFRENAKIKHLTAFIYAREHCKRALTHVRDSKKKKSNELQLQQE